MGNKKRRNSARFQLTIRFALLLTISILVLSISIVTVLSRELYDSTKEQTELLKETMKKADTKNRVEWLEFLDTYTSGKSSPYYIQVFLSSGESIYSHEARQVFSQFDEMNQFLFLQTLLWEEEDVYYYTTLEKGEDTAAILVSMEDQFDLIKRVILLSTLLTMIVLFVGVWFIARFAGVFSRPLRVMNNEIGALNLEEKKGRLTVPEDPREVKYVAESFNELLEKQERSLEREKQFVADVSHELRTPLTAIRGHVKLIRRRGEAHPEVIPKSIAYIDTESKRMTLMVEQLLTLGRLEKGTDVTDVSQLLRQIVDDFQLMIRQTLEVTIEEDVYLIAEKEHLRQIIRNLVENAAKYTEPSGSISIQLRQTKEGVTLKVADTGKGISAEERLHIFERFYRADQSRSSQVSGSGIGLSIVWALVHLYEGHINVLDNQPKGSQFVVYFPKK